MRFPHYILIAGYILAVIGFVAAGLLDKRQLGITIFLVGFFVGAASAVFIALTSDFGKIGAALKLEAGGFGIIVLGQLFGFLIGRNDLANILFFAGMAVMVAGMVVAAWRMTKF